MTLIHGAGLIGISRMLHLNADRLEERAFDYRGYLIMGAVGMLVFALHMVEIWVFAAFYLLVGAIGDLEAALHYSAVAYATLGDRRALPFGLATGRRVRGAGRISADRLVHGLHGQYHE